jgi:uncharacterized protein (DUF302 family)
MAQSPKWLVVLACAGAWLAGATSARAQPASPAPVVTSQRVSIEHVRIASTRPFAEVKAALEAKLRRYDSRIATLIRSGETERARAELEQLAAPTGLTIIDSLNHGVALSLRGKPSNAVQYGIGNVLVATQMTQHRLGAGLYAPIRVVLYEGSDGTSVFEYDQPTTSLAPLGDEDVDRIARWLDEKVRAVLMEVSR